MGLPKKEIDWDEFEKLCALHCTKTEVASFFDVSKPTLDLKIKHKYDTTFQEVFKEKSAKGKLNVRRKQLQVALGGNVVMLIWLGKNWLGQCDTPIVPFDNEEDYPAVA